MDAIKFGNRSDLIEEGKKRVAELSKINPRARLYGESEAGGLHVAYVLDDSPSHTVFLLPRNYQPPW